MKKVLLLTLVLVFALNGLCFAAKSSSKPSSPSRPSTSAPAATQNTPGSGYKPSAPASSYSDKAPAAKPPAVPQAAAQQSTGSGWMRNVGMLAGGMVLGGMLSSMLGQGSSGMLANIMGLLVSLVPIIIIFMLGRFLWSRYKTKREQGTSTRY